jgi:hypothetical protein
MSEELADTRTNVIDIDDLREPRRTPQQQSIYEYGLALKVDLDSGGAAARSEGAHVI